MMITTAMRSLAGLTLSVLSVSVAAQNCSCGTGTRLTEAQIGTLLVNKTVCAKRGTDAWQEFHSGSTAGGRVIDFKRGPNDKVDPSEDVGSWSGSGGNSANGRVTYNYGTGGTYTYEVCQNGASVHFCGANGGSNIIGAALRDGQQSCGF